MWSKTWERYHLFVSCVIKEMRKRGEFKMSLSHPRGRKVLLNSNASGGESMGRERAEPGTKTRNKTRNKKMQFQPTLKKTFCSTPLLLTHRRLKHSKRQKQKSDLSPHRFLTQSIYSISELNSKYLINPCGERSQTASIILLKRNYYSH